MWKATLRSLWSRKLRLGMSLVAIILGVAFVSGSFVFSDMLKGSFNGIISSSISDVEVGRDSTATLGKDGEFALNNEIVKKVQAVPGVKEAHGSVTGQGVMLIDTKGKAVASFGPPQLGLNWFIAPTLNNGQGAHVLEGRAPQADNEIAVDPSSLTKSGHKIGDTVKVITPEQGTIDVVIVGTATFGSGSTAGSSYIFFTDKRAQQLFMGGRDSFTSLWVVTEPGANRAEVAKKVQDVLPAGFQARDGQVVADEANTQLTQGFGFLNTFLLVFAGISLLVATFLIVNTFTILVAQRSKELALFRSMGASRGQIMSTVLLEALVVGIVGSVIGLFAGVLVALGIKALMNVTGIWDIGSAPIHLSTTAIIASLATGIIVTLLASLMPAIRATRIAPVEAMTAAKTEQEKGLGARAVVGVVLAVLGAAGILLGLLTSVGSSVALAGIGMALAVIGVAIASPLLGRPVVWLVGKVYRALFGEVGKLAELNSVRQPRRTAATASALMIGLTLVTAMSIIGASTSASVKGQVERTVRGDYLVGRPNFQPFSHQVEQRLSGVSEVEKVHTMTMSYLLRLKPDQKAPTQAQLESNNNADWPELGGMSPDDLDKIFPQRIVEGRMFSAPGEMIIEKEQATKDGLKVGDTQRYFSPQSQQVVEVKVVGIYDKGDAQAIASRWVDRQTLTAAGLGKQDNFVAVDLKPGVDQASARDALDKALADMPLVSVMNVKEYADSQLGQVNQLLGMLYGLLGLSIVIAVLGIVNTLGLSIVERTREIGLLRAIALTRPQVRRMITLESVVISLLGAVVGIGLGLVFGVVLRHLMRDQGITELAIPWVQLVLFLVAAAVVGVLAALWPASRAARTNILQAIATE